MRVINMLFEKGTDLSMYGLKNSNINRDTKQDQQFELYEPKDWREVTLYNITDAANGVFPVDTTTIGGMQQLTEEVRFKQPLNKREFRAFYQAA